MPVDWLNPGRTLFWQHSGPFNEVVFRIKDWKVWFGGSFAKRALAGKNHHYLQRFIRETWRGELCPRTAMFCAPVFFLWNPRWSDLNILAYTLAANLPCILVHH
jgi:glycosyl-4,4'-diaponeurosporenoate acyltransferase